jgi:glutamate-5-semialdehyde dehydrogenase
MDLKNQIEELGRRARASARILARATTAQKNEALLAMAREIRSRDEQILSENAKDIDRGKADQLSPAMIDRLTLNAKRIEAMAQGIEQVAALPDPVGQIISEWSRPNGLRIAKVRVPIGVVGIIYESRPNVTSDAAVLCVKTGNATILRGGSESIHSNLAIADAMQAGGARAGLPADSILLVPTTDREAVRHMAQLDRYIDMLVPRGGHALIEAVVSNARMPVIKHYHGVCIVYVDKDADLAMADQIVTNAKCQRPGVCNAMETLLVHRDIAANFLERTGRSLMNRGVEIRGDAHVRQVLGDEVLIATEEDWTTEYLDLKLAARVVDSMDDAITHIDRFGSHHSDCIVTSNEERAEKFLGEVDSATVYWNASTRFTDGGEFGFGAEIGISTDKLHARGPMALEELTTYKYVIRGNGQIRE